MDDLPGFDITKPMTLDQDAALAVAVLDHFANSAGPFTTGDATRVRSVIQRLRNASRQCPHGEPLGRCADCVHEHNEATR